MCMHFLHKVLVIRNTRTCATMQVYKCMSVHVFLCNLVEGLLVQIQNARDAFMQRQSMHTLSWPKGKKCDKKIMYIFNEKCICIHV